MVTGATGYLGSLIVARILHEGWASSVLVPSRNPDTSAMPAAIAAELSALGADPARFADRVETVRWNGAEGSDEPGLAALMEARRIRTLVHCAGCLDYFDEAALEAVNVALTRRLVSAARSAGVERVVFVSTAYAGGYRSGPVPESPLVEPERDPTAYTRTKRAAEHVVADSGLPFLIVRPSIVIGSARDGRYSGKRYGVYQQWMGIERLLADRYHAELHTVATSQPLNLVHQDAFGSAMSGILHRVPDHAFVNLVSADDASPSMRQMWQLTSAITRPRRVCFYERLEHIDLKRLHIRQRSYLTFARTNLEIGAHPWRFERNWLDCLRAAGTDYTEATLDSVRVCLDRFVRHSPVLAGYAERFAGEFPERTEFIDMPAPSGRQQVAEHAPG